MSSASAFATGNCESVGACVGGRAPWFELLVLLLPDRSANACLSWLIHCVRSSWYCAWSFNPAGKDLEIMEKQSTEGRERVEGRLNSGLTLPLNPRTQQQNKSKNRASVGSTQRSPAATEQPTVFELTDAHR